MPNIPYKESKYRPVLTYTQIQRIHQLARSDGMNDIDVSIIQVMASWISKVENASAKPAYTEKPKKPKIRSLESLGGSEINSLVVPGASKEDYWEQCYKQLIDLGTDVCSLKTIVAAKEHMYLNDLMTPEEIAAHEAKTASIDTEI